MPTTSSSYWMAPAVWAPPTYSSLSPISRQCSTSPTWTHVALVQYSYEQRLEIGLGEYGGKKELLDAILGISYWSGGTSTGAAIAFTILEVFGQSNGSKQKVMVVITDGRSYDDVRDPALATQVRCNCLLHWYCLGIPGAPRRHSQRASQGALVLGGGL